MQWKEGRAGRLAGLFFNLQLEVDESKHCIHNNPNKHAREYK